MIKFISRRNFNAGIPRNRTILSALYVPGNNQKMLDKCATYPTTLLVPDIEDSVPIQEKPKARELIIEALPKMREQTNALITPRTNEPGIPEEFCEDIEELMRFENVAKCIDGICVPKINNLNDLEYVDNALAAKEQEFQWEEERIKLVIQIESAEALVNMKEILRYDRQLDVDDGKGRIIAAAFGADDFTADMGIHRDDDYTKLDFARRMFALNCAAFGVISIDTPYVHYKDQEGLKQELSYLKGVGMRAKFAIHPTQIPIINEEMGPSAEEAQYYRELIEAFDEAQKNGKAAINFQDKMVDIAAYRRAKKIVELWEAIN